MTRIAFENAWLGLLGLPLVVAILLASAWAQRRSGRSWPTIAALVGTRTVVLLMLLVLASGPERITSDEETAPRDRVAVLIDRSESMSLETSEMTRYRAAVELLRKDLLPSLRDMELRVDPFLFAEDIQGANGKQIAEATPDGKETDLAGAITRSLSQRASPPAAIFALTDGATTVDQENTRAVARLVEYDVPFFGIGFGRESAQRTLSLELAVAPPVVAPRQVFFVSAQLRATGETELPPFDLMLLRDGQFLQKRTIAPGMGARIWQESFRVEEDEQGYHAYTVRLLPPSERSVTCPKTEGTVAVRVVDEQELRILFVQGGLTWDYKFIRLALQEDSIFRVSGLSRVSSRAAFLQDVNEDGEMAGGFPATLKGLAVFRVVILSNVAASDLTPQQQELLARFCSELGGGVLVVGGAKTFNASWRASRLEQLLPVRIADLAAQPSAGRPFRIRLTEQALSHPVFQIGDSAPPQDAWSKLPEFRHAANVSQVKPGAQVWAVQVAANRSSRATPLMVTQRYGGGRSAVICVQNFWRWRLAHASNPEHFDRFWQQLLRYLSEAGRDRVVLRLTDQQFRPAEDIRVLLQRRPDPNVLTTDPAEFRFRVLDGSRNVVTQQVSLPPGQTTEVVFRVPEPGRYKLDVHDRHGAVAATRSLEVSDVSREMLHTARDMSALRQWATLSGGRALPEEDFPGASLLCEEIRDRRTGQEQSSVTRKPLGMSAGVFAILLSCLSAEWLLRKRWGRG